MSNKEEIPMRARTYRLALVWAFAISAPLFVISFTINAITYGRYMIVEYTFNVSVFLSATTVVFSLCSNTAKCSNCGREYYGRKNIFSSIIMCVNLVPGKCCYCGHDEQSNRRAPQELPDAQSPVPTTPSTPPAPGENPPASPPSP